LLKNVQKRVLFEMLSNSRRSDRELAKALKISQPTVTRVRRWLETNGFILQYTLIPDFAKIGFELVVFTFFKVLVDVPGEGRDHIMQNVMNSLANTPNGIAVLHGEGMGCDGVLVSYHENFSDFATFIRELKMNNGSIGVVGSFIAAPEGQEGLTATTFKHLKEYMDETVKQ
jgi:DNA-binding Lrp family transcriptional regulator